MANEPISQILSRRINAMGLSKQFAAARVCAMADGVGKGEFRSISFKNGVLKISVDSNARAHLIKLREQTIIAEINEKLKNRDVGKIVFEVKG